jgi:hypothetical protein
MHQSTGQSRIFFAPAYAPPIDPDGRMQLIRYDEPHFRTPDRPSGASIGGDGAIVYRDGDSVTSSISDSGDGNFLSTLATFPDSTIDCCIAHASKRFTNGGQLVAFYPDTYREAWEIFHILRPCGILLFFSCPSLYDATACVLRDTGFNVCAKVVAADWIREGFAQRLAVVPSGRHLIDLELTFRRLNKPSLLDEPMVLAQKPLRMGPGKARMSREALRTAHIRLGIVERGQPPL